MTDTYTGALSRFAPPVESTNSIGDSANLFNYLSGSKDYSVGSIGNTSSNPLTAFSNRMTELGYTGDASNYTAAQVAAMTPEDQLIWKNTFGSTDTPWYQDNQFLGNAAGLGSALVQMANLPSQIKLAKTQTKALEQNIATAKEEQTRRNNNISAFNAVRT